MLHLNINFILKLTQSWSLAWEKEQGLKDKGDVYISSGT